MRTLLATGAAVAAMLGGPILPAARAALNERIDFETDFEDTASCVDTLNVHLVVFQVAHQYADRDGTDTRQAITGKLKITFTNVRTGATFSPNTSGPLTLDLVTGEIVVRGGNVGPIDGVYTLTNGRLVVSNGELTRIPHHQIDVCSAVGSTPNV
jgi:hypothetical protein